MKGKRKQSKKGPLKQPPLPQAGDSTYTRLMNHLLEGFLLWVFAVLAFALVAFSQWMAWWRHRPDNPWMMTGLTVILAIIAAFRTRKTFKTIRALRLGFLGEMVVGQQLEGLRSRGYRVYHDLPEKGYNIDHVLIGPGGVFVIETKTRSKPAQGNAEVIYDGKSVLVDGWAPDRDPIKQVQACADRVREVLLTSTGKKPKVRPVVLYPGWWVTRQAKDVNVWVLNPDAFIKFLDHEPVVLAPTDIALLGTALESHIRSASY